jgi:hypothetical protein
MASNYQKLNTKIFNERLANKQYANATGARRAVGKSEMSEDEKRKAYASIDKHFGVAAAPAKASAAPKSKRAVAKKGATKASAAAAKTGRGAARGKRTAAKKTASARSAKSAPAEGAPALPTLADLHAGAEATRAAMAGLGEAAGIDPSLDVKSAARKGAEILQHSIDQIGALLGHKEPAAAVPPTPASVPSTLPPPAPPESGDGEMEDEGDGA